MYEIPTSKRQTVAVEDLRQWVNDRLANPRIPQEVKRGYAAMLENVLHCTEHYKGYNVLPNGQEYDRIYY